MTKLEKLRNKMKESGIDAVIVLDELNQHYLCEFAFTDGFLLITPAKAYIVTDFRYYEMALIGANKSFEVLTPADRTEFLNKALAEEGCTKVGFEGGSVSYDVYRRYCEKHPHLTFENIGDTIEVIRQIKTPDEIEKMQRAQDITDKAFSHILKVINRDMTELDVAVELEYAMRKNGASAFAFDTISVSGDASALPHGTPRNVKLRDGFLTMDFGAKFDGYCSDMTRTIVIGDADAEMRRVYDTVLRAQCAVLDAIDWHSNCAEMDKIARDIIDNAGYKGKFGHSLGHGVGLFIHEKPGLNSGNTAGILENGHVVTVEPGIYLEGQYGVRIEDMVIIHNNRAENITKSKKELIIL